MTLSDQEALSLELEADFTAKMEKEDSTYRIGANDIFDLIDMMNTRGYIVILAE